MKKSFLVLFLFIFACIFEHARGQQAQTDSLKTVLVNCKNDSAKCIVLNALFEITTEKDKISCNEQLKQIAEKLDDIDS